MRHTQSKVLLLAAIGGLILTRSAHAQEVKEIPWNQVCREAVGHRLLLTTVTGGETEGVCFSINADEISISTGHGMTKVARASITKIIMHRAPDHQLRELGRGVRNGLKWGAKTITTPGAPVALAGFPLILAWGAISSPFCLIGDLKAHFAGTEEIKPR